MSGCGPRCECAKTRSKFVAGVAAARFWIANALFVFAVSLARAAYWCDLPVRSLSKIRFD